MKSILTSVIFSIPAVCSAGWSEYGQIVSVMPYDNGNLHIWANMTRYDPGSCGNDRYVMPANNQNIKESLSVALTALTTKQKVRFLVDGICTQGNPTLMDIQIGP